MAGFVGAGGERRVLAGFAGLVAGAARLFGLGSLGPLGPGWVLGPGWLAVVRGIFGTGFGFRVG